MPTDHTYLAIGEGKRRPCAVLLCPARLVLFYGLVVCERCFYGEGSALSGCDVLALNTNN